MKRTQLILVIFIIILMISSVLGFVVFSPYQDDQNINSINYNGHDFYVDETGKYQVIIDNNLFIFDYLPSELESVEIPEFTFKNTKYYLITNTSEEDENLIYSLNKLGYTLNLIGVRPVLACINEESCTQDIPIKDCSEDAFLLKKSNINKVYLQDKCIILEGDSENINKFVDKVNLKLIGII